MTRGSLIPARASLGALAAVVLGLLAVVLGAPAHAADSGLTIDHAETHGGRLQLLVSVPAGSQVDLSSVGVSVGGRSVQATASSASRVDAVRRTTVLALDTSNSMRGQRITEAVKAARTYLDTVPDNVAVGLVSFDSTVRVLQAASRDHAAVRAALARLTLAKQTSLYAGVQQAIDSTGHQGQREILLLSDGKDTTGTALQPLLRQIHRSGVRLDVVALQQDAGPGSPLARMTDAGKGTVLHAGDPQALTQAFADEADALARQVLVTATVPSGMAGQDASVQVSLAAASPANGSWTGSAFLSLGKGASPAPKAPPAAAAPPQPVTASSLAISRPVALGAIAAIGLGVLGIAVALIRPAKPKPPSIEEHIQSYGVGATAARAAALRASGSAQTSASIADQAREAAGKVLASNRGLEARIADRLEGADLALKPAEWLLLHGGIAIAAGLLGLLLGRGNPVAVLLFLVLGGVGPWVYLVFQGSQRRRAFDNGLADTLQLISGSLSAGLSLAQSLDTVVREGTEPISSEFRRVIVESRLGVSLEDAMEGVAQRMQSKDFAWVVMAIRIQREVGGNLAELLLTVAATLRERAYLRRHVRALSAEGRLSCWILGGLPPVFMVYLVLAKGDYVRPMFTTSLGLLMCGAAVVMLAVGIFWMSKVAKVEV